MPAASPSSSRKFKIFGMSPDFLAVMIFAILPLIYLFNMDGAGIVGAQLFGRPVTGTIVEKSSAGYDWRHRDSTGYQYTTKMRDTDLVVEFQPPGNSEKTRARTTVSAGFWSQHERGEEVEVYAMAFWPYGAVIRGSFWGCKDVQYLLLTLGLGFGLIGGLVFALRKDDTKA